MPLPTCTCVEARPAAALTSTSSERLARFDSASPAWLPRRRPRTTSATALGEHPPVASGFLHERELRSPAYFKIRFSPLDRTRFVLNRWNRFITQESP